MQTGRFVPRRHRIGRLKRASEEHEACPELLCGVEGFAVEDSLIWSVFQSAASPQELVRDFIRQLSGKGGKVRSFDQRCKSGPRRTTLEQA